MKYLEVKIYDQKLVYIRCVHHDLFQKADYVCYRFNGSRTHNSLLFVSQSLGKLMGIVGHCEAPIPCAGCRCVGGQCSHSWDRGAFWGLGCKLGSFGSITLARTVHTHTRTSCLVHMVQQIRRTVISEGACFSAPTCLYGPRTEGRLGPLERSAVSARDIISVKL